MTKLISQFSKDRMYNNDNKRLIFKNLIEIILLINIKNNRN